MTQGDGPVLLTRGQLFSQVPVALPSFPSRSQMTIEDVAPHLSRQRPGLPNQAPSDMGERARSLMRSQRRCESLPAFRQAVRALVDAAYPRWFAEAFVVDEQDTPPPPLRPCERLGDPERGS